MNRHQQRKQKFLQDPDVVEGYSKWQQNFNLCKLNYRSNEILHAMNPALTNIAGSMHTGL